MIETFEPEIADGFSESNHEGYTGKGFFNLDNSAYSKATFMITSDQSAEHARVMIRYAFAGSTNRDMKITIDNGVYDVAFPPTGSWDKWDTVYIDDVWVDALDFKVILQSTTSDGGPNVDMIAFDMANVYRTGCKAAREKNKQTTLNATRRHSIEPKTKGFTVNALGRKVQNVKNREDLKKLPQGNYFQY